MKKTALISALLASLFAVLTVTAQEDDATADGSSPEASADGAPEEPVSDDVFIPTEEVQAAEELVYPVDI